MPGMSEQAIERLRIHLYGTQGSGSIFPSRRERAAFRQREQIDLLKLVFEELSQRADSQGRIRDRVEEILGGPIDHTSLSAYAARRQPVLFQAGQATSGQVGGPTENW